MWAPRLTGVSASQGQVKVQGRWCSIRLYWKTQQCVCVCARALLSEANRRKAKSTVTSVRPARSACGALGSSRQPRQAGTGIIYSQIRKLRHREVT